MKILMINVVCGIRSTGRICTDLAVELEKNGHEVKIAYGRETVPEKFEKYAVRIGNEYDVLFHGLKARLFDAAGFGSKCATRKFVEWVKQYDPDIIHLHNIHGYYINVEILFEYLRKCGKKIIWTLHDCWAFTGHCTYFDYVGCDKWKTGCNRCLQKKEYPTCDGISRAKKNYNKKRELFTNVPDMQLVTPSRWLANLIKISFMKKYAVQVIHNGINTKNFHYRENDVHKKLGIENKKIILGVAAVWDKRKGLESFAEIAKKIGDDYRIVLVGLSKQQIKMLPNNITGIEKTNNIQELIDLYSAAYVFINPTLEDNYPTTHLEAIACGTPVITYDTGGCKESAELLGRVVSRGDIEKILEIIKTNLNEKVENERTKISIEHMLNEYMCIYQNGIK